VIRVRARVERLSSAGHKMRQTGIDQTATGMVCACAEVRPS
jgi:hypothetical protein